MIVWLSHEVSPVGVPFVAGSQGTLRGEARSRRRRGGCRRTVACVDRPTEDIDGCQAAHSRLAAAIDDLPDAVVRQPSLLPDWTVGHVLTHLARNAEAMVRRIEAATRGELIDQYPGGARGRAAEIEAGADRPAHELITDVRNWAQRLDRCKAVSIRLHSCPSIGCGRSRYTLWISESASNRMTGRSNSSTGPFPG